MKYILIAIIGALASMLANKGIAVFNDGFRPIIPQYFEGKMRRSELAATSFAVSFGLVIGFGIPASIGASIFLVHSILLATDIIGTFFKDDLKGLIGAGVVGALYGVGLLFGLDSIVNLFEKLPYNFLGDLGMVSSPVVSMFAIFPAVAIAMQHGFKKGAIAGIIVTLAYFLVKRFGTFSIGEATVALNAEGIGLLIGVVIMLIYAMREKGTKSSNEDLLNVFSDKVERIQKNWWMLSIMGGLLSASAAMNLIAGDPASLALMKEGQFTNAAIASLARAIGFIPLVFSTAIVTGVYGTAGVTFVWGVGILLHGNPLVAFVAGALVMFIEVKLIGVFARGLDKFPGIRDMGEHIRTSMSKVLSIALLVGSVNAANTMAPGVGALFVAGVYLLNKQSKKPLVDLAVGPVAAIIFGILLNILIALGIHVLPVE